MTTTTDTTMTVAEAGRKGRSVNSPAQAAASRANGAQPVKPRSRQRGRPNKYHPDAGVNQNCHRVIEQLRAAPMTIRELSKALTLGGYDVAVALGVLADHDHVIRCNGGKFELLHQ